MASFEQTGKVIALGELKTGVGKESKPWISQDVVIEFTDGNYTNHAVFNGFNNNTIETLGIGDEIKVFFNLKANKLNDGRWFGKCSIWKIEVLNKASDWQSKAEPLPTSNVAADESGDLPF